jgi:L,D-transpeptidase YcbB
MTKNMAVSMRAGLVPAAVALLFMGTLAARAEKAPSKLDSQNSSISVAAKPEAGDAPTVAEAKPEAEPAEDVAAAKPAAAEAEHAADDESLAAAPADDAAIEGDEPAEMAASEPDPAAKSGDGKETAAADATDTAKQKVEPKVAEPEIKRATAKVEEPTPDAAADEAKPTTAKVDEPDPDAADDSKTAKSDADEASAELPKTAALSGPEDTEKTDEAAAEEAKTDDEPAAVVPPRSTAALPEPVAEADGALTDQVLPPADAVVANIRSKLPEAARGATEDEAAALTRFYQDHSGPAIWVSSEGLTEKGKAVVGEIRKADDWGLNASDFRLPAVSGSLSDDAVANAEIEIATAVLKYARYARGGRISNPKTISNIYNHTPTLRAPKAVLLEIAASSEPDAYLRAVHPQHEQFQRLQKVLVKLRGSEGQEEEEPEEDPALSVKLPPGRLLRAGMDDPQVALLRKRLSVPAADEAAETYYDEELQDAVRKFQRANRLRPDAIIGNNTRAVLNGRPKPQVASTESKITRVLINMERWRWVPEDLGEYHVWDNVPEFLTRIVKNGRVVHADKIIVGQPSWPTPVFSADMKHLVFNPQWGVPNGIKTKELWPLLRKSSGAGFFGIFGGGYSSQAVLDAYDLRISHRGRPVDPNQVDWNSVDIRSYDFIQPPGPKNVLGVVKFMFPNKHDVYMHDTPERHLFAKSFRALSHGCMRVEEPRKLAEVLLAEDKGWSRSKVNSMFGGYSNTVKLDKHIPVHVTYMTARVDDEGKLHTYGDFYGLDSRTSSALIGRSVRFEKPSYADDGPVASAPAQYQPQRKQKQQKYSGPPTIADAINNLFSP